MANKQIAVVYVPAIHKGYIDFFKKHPGDLYIVGEELLKEISLYKYLERDVRMGDGQDMLNAIKGIGANASVRILDKDNVADIKGEVVMPEDRVSHEIAEKFLNEVDVEYEDIFLRWDMPAAVREFKIPDDRTITSEDLHLKFMGEAYKEVGKSSDWFRQIGSIIVKNGEIVARAHNRHLPTDHSMDAYGDPRSNFDAGERYDLSTAIHSEASLIAEAARKGISLDGAELYVTTFPCPTCAKSVAEAGIKKVYYCEGYSILDAENVLNAAEVEIILVKEGGK